MYTLLCSNVDKTQVSLYQWPTNQPGGLICLATRPIHLFRA